jgi:predicted PurR-regulated permease PerM
MIGSMNPERVRVALAWALLTVAVAFSVVLLRPFLFCMAWAAVLAVIAWPMHRRISRRLRRPSVAAALSCLLATVAIVLPVMLVAVQVTQEATALVESLQSAPDGARVSRWLRPLEHPAIAPAYRWLMERVDWRRLDLDSAVRQLATLVSGFLARQSIALVGNLVWGIAQSVLSLVTLFFLLRDWPLLSPRLRAFFSLNGAPMEALFTRAVRTIHAAIYGAAVVAVAQGTLGGLAFWALGLPRPFLWGTVMAVLCLIPLAGAPIVWIPAALVLTAQGQYGKAIALALWGLLVIGLVDNVLRPLVIGARTRLHLLTAIFGVLGGLLLMGPLGLLLGPAILGATLDLLEAFQSQLAGQDATLTVGPSAPPGSAATQAAAGSSVSGRRMAEHSSLDPKEQEPSSSAASR